MSSATPWVLITFVNQKKKKIENNQSFMLLHCTKDISTFGILQVIIKQIQTAGETKYYIEGKTWKIQLHIQVLHLKFRDLYRRAHMNSQRVSEPAGPLSCLGTKRKQTWRPKGTTGCLASNGRDKSLAFEQMFVHIWTCQPGSRAKPILNWQKVKPKN